MTTATQWITHYERLLLGSLSPEQRAQAEQELAFWREQAIRQESPPPPQRPTLRITRQPDALAIWMFQARRGIYVRTA